MILPLYFACIRYDRKVFKEWEEYGIHPLVQEEKAEEILKDLCSFHN